MEIKDVENLDNLARLELSDQEKEEILSDMKGILEYVKVVEGVEVPTGVGIPTRVGIRNVWREDEIIPRDFSHELIVEQFPNQQDGFLKVKKIL